jgi:hypothetical protein
MKTIKKQEREKKQKPSYFSTEEFINNLLKELKMDKADPDVKQELANEISQTLTDRVTAVVVASLRKKDVFLLEKTIEDHPELDIIDCLSIITSYVPGLDDKIVKSVADLYDEIVEIVGIMDKKYSY